MLWLLESGLVAIARLLLYLRLLGQVTNLFPQLTRRLSAGEPHARVRGPCAQFGGMGLEHVQQPLPVALVVPDALVVAKHALVGEDAAQPDDQMGAPLARLGVLPSHDALFARPELLHPALDVGHLLLDAPVDGSPVAIYSLHVSNVSRAAGSSAVASCSYITSRRMRDERTGEAFNGFGRRERVEHVCTMLPEGAPGEYLDPERLFNAVEMAEKRSDARPAKKIMVALPREFDARERFRALEDFISWNITANGYACTYAIHTDKDGRNPHAHILVANRRIDPKTGRWAAKSRSEFALDANGRRIPVIDPDTGRQKIGARNRKVWKRVNVSNNPLDSKEFLERLRREWADSCNALLPGYAVIDHRSFKARGIERIPTIHEGYASREMEKRGGRGDLCEENRRIQALNRLLDALRAMIGRLSDQAQGILTAVKRRQRPSGAPQAPSSPEPAERPQERPQARETPPQAPQEPPKPIRTKKALTDRFKTRLDERLAENERKQAEKQAEPDMEETWDLSAPADPLNIGMGWGTGGHGLGL